MGEEGDDRRWDGWVASLTQWTWVWVGSGSWWWTGKPGMLQSMGSQELDTTEWLDWTELYLKKNLHVLIYLAVLGLSHGWRIFSASGRICCWDAWALWMWQCGRRSCSVWAYLLHSMWDLSSPTRNRTCITVPVSLQGIARQIPNHWTTKKVPLIILLSISFQVSTSETVFCRTTLYSS